MCFIPPVVGPQQARPVGEGEGERGVVVFLGLEQHEGLDVELFSEDGVAGPQHG